MRTSSRMVLVINETRMHLKDQVASFDLAEKLFNLEVSQDSYFVWSLFEYGTHEEWKVVPYEERTTSGHYSAFTVAELGEMLPLRIDARGKRDGRKHIAYFLDYQAA